MRAAERAGVAGEAVEAVGLDESLLLHTLRRGKVGLLQQTHRVLLRVDILTRDFQIVIVVKAHADGLGHLVGDLLATQYSTGTFANANGIAGTVGVEAKDLAAFHEQLAVRDKTCADVDDVDVVNDLFSSRYGLEVLASSDDGTCDACMVGIRDGTNQDVTRHNRDTKTAHAVGLHGEAALAGHRLDDGLDGGSGLHTLIGGQVADVSCTHGEDFLT